MSTVSTVKQPTKQPTKKPAPPRRAKKNKTKTPLAPPESPGTLRLRQTFLPEHFRVTRSKTQLIGAKEQDTNAIIDGLRNKCEDGLEVRNGLAHSKGKGVFALKEFKKGALVCEYSGQLISKKEADKREKEYEGKPEFGCYMYYFKFKSKTMCVDATKDNGRMGRLLNHSKTKANVVTKLFEIDSLPYLALLAKRDISVGEELVYDYGDRSTKAVQLFPWLEK